MTYGGRLSLAFKTITFWIVESIKRFEECLLPFRTLRCGVAHAIFAYITGKNAAATPRLDYRFVRQGGHSTLYLDARQGSCLFKPLYEMIDKAMSQPKEAGRAAGGDGRRHPRNGKDRGRVMWRGLVWLPGMIAS